MNCMSQSYDSTMLGKYNGMQAIIKDVNPLAIWIPCSAHSLNLVATRGVGSSPLTTAFFVFIQRLYNLFSAPRRWSLLMDVLKSKKLPIIKRVINTRWPANAEATRALAYGYEEIKSMIQNFLNSDTHTLNPASTDEANYLFKYMQLLESYILTNMWNTILYRINLTSKELQRKDIDLNQVLLHLKSLCEYIRSKRDVYEDILREARVNCTSDFQESTKRYKIRKLRIDEEFEEIIESPSLKFKREYCLPMIDSLIG